MQLTSKEKEALSNALEEEETKEFQEKLQTQGWYGKAKMYAGRWLSKLWGFFKKHWVLLATVGLFAASYYCANSHNKVKIIGRVENVGKKKMLH